jgi:hypothetical protein
MTQVPPDLLPYRFSDGGQRSLFPARSFQARLT